MSCKPLQSEHLHITFGVFLLTFNVVDEDSCKSMVIWICGWCLLWSCHLRGTLSFAMFIVHLKRIEGRFDVNDSVPYNTIALCLKGMVSLRKFCRPRLGVEMINLYSASLGMLEKIIEKVPNISKGVLVEKVTKGSPAESAGLFFGDVIVQCDNIIVRSLLELHDIIFDKVGKSVELAVIREGGAHLKLDMMVEETGPDEFNRWPLPEEIKIQRARLVN